MSTTFNDPVVMTSALTLGGGLANTLSRDNLTQDTFAVYQVPLTALAVWNNLTNRLPASAATDDLGLIDNTFGTGSPTLQTSDAKATSVTQRGRFLFGIPPEYDPAESVRIRIYGGMKTTVSDGTATVDVECYKVDKYAGIGSDICATAATTINSLLSGSPTPQDFTITSSTLARGDLLDVRVTIAITDSATGTAVIGEIGAIEVHLDVRG